MFSNAKVQPPCDHPVSAIVSSDEGTSYCRQCEEDSTPRRIQRRRVKGWTKPANTVCIGRGKHQKWGNPFKVGEHGVDKAEVVRLFRQWLLETPEGRDLSIKAQRELRGKHLACWCRLDEPCHADVLLEVASGAR